MPESIELRITVLREKIGLFPKTPGVYLMKDAEGRVLYIGKARDGIEECGVEAGGVGGGGS